MITLTINKEKKQCPSGWHEVSVKQFQRMLTEWPDHNDVLKLFCILTDTDFKDMKKSTDLSIENTLWSVIDFVYRDFDLQSIEMPKYLKVKDKVIEVPKYLGNLSLEQAIHLRKRIETAEDLRECISYSTAIYIQPLYDEDDFTLTRAKEFEEVVLSLPIVDVYPIGFFLLTRLRNSGKQHSKILNQAKKIRTKARKQLQRWLRFSGSLDSQT